MSKISEFINPSPKHQVSHEEGGFTIIPKNEALEFLQEFQAIAKRACLYRGGDYRVIEHRDSDSPIENSIDSVTFLKL